MRRGPAFCIKAAEALVCPLWTRGPPTTKVAEPRPNARKAADSRPTTATGGVCATNAAAQTAAYWRSVRSGVPQRRRPAALRCRHSALAEAALWQRGGRQYCYKQKRWARNKCRFFPVRPNRAAAHSVSRRAAAGRGLQRPCPPEKTAVVFLTATLPSAGWPPPCLRRSRRP